MVIFSIQFCEIVRFDSRVVYNFDHCCPIGKIYIDLLLLLFVFVFSTMFECVYDFSDSLIHSWIGAPSQRFHSDAINRQLRWHVSVAYVESIGWVKYGRR